ncbi:MAG: DUF3567 family protein [Burkholderiales bacterium]
MKIDAIQDASEVPVVMTNVLFNSPHYYVAEISQGRSLSGFEVVDKFTGRGAFIDGAVAARMRASFQAMVNGQSGDVTPDQVDEFLGDFDAMLMQRVVFH